jgi:hypothetical protein
MGSGSLWTKQNGPTILTGAGLVGFAVTTALAIRQTSKAQPVMDKIAANLEVARGEKEESKDTPAAKATQRELVKAYAKASLELAEVYWPVAAMGAASAVAIIAGHRTMLKRQASLVAAYSLLDAGFKAYRKKVAEVIGEDKEEELWREQQAIALGRERGLEACERIAAEDTWPASPYSFFFTEGNANWKPSPEYNKFFLVQQQNWANHRLQTVGYIFLNEILSDLGIERTQAGQHVGWKIGQDDSDQYVDFGIFDISDEVKRAFVNGFEDTILLNFNCVMITI